MPRAESGENGHLRESGEIMSRHRKLLFAEPARESSYHVCLLRRSACISIAPAPMPEVMAKCCPAFISRGMSVHTLSGMGGAEKPFDIHLFSFGRLAFRTQLYRINIVPIMRRNSFSARIESINARRAANIKASISAMVNKSSVHHVAAACVMPETGKNIISYRAKNFSPAISASVSGIIAQAEGRIRRAASIRARSIGAWRSISSS